MLKVKLSDDKEYELSAFSADNGQFILEVANTTLADVLAGFTEETMKTVEVYNDDEKVYTVNDAQMGNHVYWDKEFSTVRFEVVAVEVSKQTQANADEILALQEMVKSQSETITTQSETIKTQQETIEAQASSIADLEDSLADLIGEGE